MAASRFDRGARRWFQRAVREAPPSATSDTAGPLQIIERNGGVFNVIMLTLPSHNCGFRSKRAHFSGHPRLYSQTPYEGEELHPVGDMKLM